VFVSDLESLLDISTLLNHRVVDHAMRRLL